MSDALPFFAKLLDDAMKRVADGMIKSLDTEMQKWLQRPDYWVEWDV